MRELLRQFLAVYISVLFVLQPISAAGLNLDLQNNRGNTNLTHSSRGINVVNIGRINIEGYHIIGLKITMLKVKV